MNKNDFLKHEHIAPFINYLVEELKGKRSIAHNYQMETKGKSNKLIDWNCKNVFDAYSNYEWPFSFNSFLEQDKLWPEELYDPVKFKVKGRTYDESEVVLSILSSELRQAVSDGNTQKCFECCHMILDWGGVLGGEKSGNLRFLLESKEYLASYLQQIKMYFESSELTLGSKYTVNVSGENYPIKMNAGFTKIYALLCDSFVIYDGRVGAALGLIEKKFYNDENIPQSEILSFRFGKAKNPKVNRNPSDETYEFKALHSSNPIHTTNNIKANWILDKAISSLPNTISFGSCKAPLRALEAALFMIGYRV